MSKLKAALITAIIGSSTAAMASPSLTFSADAQFSWGSSSSSNVIVRDHRTPSMPAPAPMPMPSTTWISLGNPLALRTGRDVLRTDVRNVSQIRLQASMGLSYIQKVTVRFTDGAVQTQTFNQWLTSRNPMLQFDTQSYHRGIDSITVVGTAGYRNQGGSYQVFVQGSRTVTLPRPPSVTELPYHQGGYPAYELPVSNPMPVNQAPVLISSELTFAGTLGFRQFPVQANLGHFSTLRVQGYGAGPLSLSRIIVTFANGQIQEIDHINRTLAPGETADLRLDARGAGQIAQLVIYTNDTMSYVPSVTGSFMISAF